MAIIQVYAPTSAAPKEELKSFYNDLEECLESIDEKFVFIMGHFNAKLESEAEIGPCTGPHSIGSTNKNGYSLAKSCMKYNFESGKHLFQIFRNGPIDLEVAGRHNQKRD